MVSELTSTHCVENLLWCGVRGTLVCMDMYLGGTSALPLFSRLIVVVPGTVQVPGLDDGPGMTFLLEDRP